MIKYSHVRLFILCDTAGVDEINRHLGVTPSEMVFDAEAAPPPTGLTHTWCLDSPMGNEGDPTARLEALADVIETFAHKLVTLDKKFPRFIDIVYHVTPQRADGITGEFDWFRCPAPLMARTSGWNLDVSYESFWYDHPEWARIRASWWRRLLMRLRLWSG